MAQNKLTIGRDIQIKAIDKTTYSNVDVVLLSSLPSDAKQPSSLVDGCVRIIDDKGVELLEVEDVSIDSATNAGNKFCIGSDRIIKLILSKASVSDVNAAKTKFNGMTVYYDYREDLKLDEKNFDLKIFDSTGGKIYDSCPITLEQAMNMINMYSKTFDVQEMGKPRYSLENMAI